MMKMYQRILLIATIASLISINIYGEEFVGDKLKQSKNVKASTAGCTAASAYQFLDINNVRCRINTGGDMWWNLDTGAGSRGQYFIPANTTKSSLFVGSLWIGGLDVNDQLKLAALRYRQIGNDYWTGPLTIDGTAAVDAAVCAEYDKFFVISRAEVDEFLGWWYSTNRSEEYPGYSIPKSIMDWPAHGDPSKFQSYYLAPFYDMDGNGEYDPNQGDYPYYDIPNELCHSPVQTMEGINGIVKGSILADQVLKGDKTLWWVFNDKGNIHTESSGQAIGLEIRAQAFAFSTNDEINNMTFCSYEIINRSTFTLTQTYFAPNTDPDLGYAWDDYVGCDVLRGMGYCYNGKAVDGTGQSEAYGDQPPAVGIDFFQGPYLDPDGYDNPSFLADGILGPSFNGDCSIVNFDSTVIVMTYGKPGEEKTGNFMVRSAAINGVNFGNGIVDDERFGMRRFVYYNNAGGIQGDPSIAAEYYNYLRGIWKDNTKMVYGGNAHPSNPGAVGPETDFMFPGDSDPCNWSTGGAPPNGGLNQNGLYWTEVLAGNAPSDRRFVQSAGPFTLEPGAVNYITFGVPWARAISGGPYASVELLRVVDDKCQALFDNCFKVLDGPDAPDLTIQELDRELIIYITNKKTSNNHREGYVERDITIKTGDSLYRFEGYQIFQLKDASVSVESIHDPAKARLVFQCDIRNGVTKLVNHYPDQAIGYSVPVVEVAGGDKGISHVFRIREDAFATGDNRLVNHKQYYYLAIAYAYNEFKKYTVEPTGLDGQKKPYLAGRKNIKVYTGIPHKTVNGLVTQSNFNDGPVITRIQGQGNGGMSLELSQATIDEILSKPMASIDNTYGSPDYPIAYQPIYQPGMGPLNITVIDPLNVKKGRFSLQFIRNVEQNGVLTNAAWIMKDEEGKIYRSDSTINYYYQQLFLDLGLAVHVYQVLYPGDSLSINNGFIESNLIYADSSRRYLSGVYDNNIPSSPQNWIRAGTYKDRENPKYNDWNMTSSPQKPWDANEYYEKVIGGMWSPYGLCAYHDQSNEGPAYNVISKNLDPLSKLASVDIVLTPDKSKWTRSVVIEMCSDPKLSEGGVKRFNIRAAPSVNKEGKKADPNSPPSTNPDDPNYISAVGFSWFPGYAINLETGERLNIMFGEDSWLSGHNGRDMLWNPTSTLYENNQPIFGGKHYVYVMQHTQIIIQGDSIYEFPAYDGCRYISLILQRSPENIMKTAVYGSTMWVGMPIMDGTHSENWLSNDARFRIRVSKPYLRYYSRPLPPGSTDTTNNNFPLYGFSTEGLEPIYNDIVKIQKDLDLINIVPNPYYAYSSYENNALDNRVKFTNLPKKCIITIYNMSGTLIRQFTKDDPTTYLDWDLKNFAGIPVAGGVYIVHVKSDGGERILKWFGALRPIDLNTF
ncbi:MAG TPA: T9SS type A sorting domain-containing protein [Bacteroidales bacterium]|nr:T9SS type A sorting domain-containing protein [Bacteroidales bacterium]